MSWPAPQLFAWIERIETRAGRATMFELLEVPSSADSKAVQIAFLRVAAGAHPDLHRHTLQPADAERLVRAYGKVAAAYATLRDQRTRDKYRKELAEHGKPIMQPPVIAGSQPSRPGSSPPPLGMRSTGPMPMVERTATSPPVGAAARTMPPPGGTPSVARTTTPPNVARTTTPPNVARTTTPANVARTTTPPNVARTMAPAQVAAGSSSGFDRRAASTTGTRETSRPPDGRRPLITPAPARTTPAPVTPSRVKPPSRPPGTPTPGGASPGDSRPPGASVGARAQVYFRKAKSCLSQGDLGGALFNLRLAAAADPGSSLIRVALAEVEAELGTKKP
jgi:hypothetical protein